MGKRKTEEIEHLTKKAIHRIPKPYSEDVIEDVLVTIENDFYLRMRYKKICRNFDSPGIVNTWIGKYTKQLTGMMRMCNFSNNVVTAPARRTNLAKTYTKLTFDRRRACR